MKSTLPPVTSCGCSFHTGRAAEQEPRLVTARPAAGAPAAIGGQARDSGAERGPRRRGAAPGRGGSRSGPASGTPSGRGHTRPGSPAAPPRGRELGSEPLWPARGDQGAPRPLGDAKRLPGPGSQGGDRRGGGPAGTPQPLGSRPPRRSGLCVPAPGPPGGARRLARTAHVRPARAAGTRSSRLRRRQCAGAGRGRGAAVGGARPPAVGADPQTARVGAAGGGTAQSPRPSAPGVTRWLRGRGPSLSTVRPSRWQPQPGAGAASACGLAQPSALPGSPPRRPEIQLVQAPAPPLGSPLLCTCHGPCLAVGFGPELSPSHKSTPCSKGPWAPRARPAGSSSLGPQSSQLTATADPRPSTRIASPTEQPPHTMAGAPGHSPLAPQGQGAAHCTDTAQRKGPGGLREPRSHLVLPQNSLTLFQSRCARAKARLPTNLCPRMATPAARSLAGLPPPPPPRKGWARG